jgi:hypothetical protein
MPFISRRAQLHLTVEDRGYLDRLAQSRTESATRVQRAQILQRYAGGQTVSAIAAALHTNRPKVERCVSKALELGFRAALRDLPGRGRRRSITDEDSAWVVNLACQKPKDLGYAQELWTTRLLAEHIQKHCLAEGHPQLQKLGRGTVSKILSAHPLKPHQIRYYLERRDPEFKAKLIEVLHVYRDVELWRKTSLPSEVVGVLSDDGKPGIQAIGNTAPDLPPVPGRHTSVGRDHEYKRDGTVSLLAGIELLSGEVLGLVRDRHRSTEFIEFHQLADQHYAAGLANGTRHTAVWSSAVDRTAV